MAAVRGIVSALENVGKGEITEKEINLALAGKEKNFGYAKAENLVLMNVDYGFEFNRDERALKMIKQEIMQKLQSLAITNRFYTGLIEII